MSEYPRKAYPTIGCCGLDCCLCPRYYTVGSSRCPGCCGPDFFNKHPSCSYITCCVRRKNLEICAQCDEFPCSKFQSWLEDGREYDSFITHRKAHHNLNLIRDHGIEKFLEQQRIRTRLLEKMLRNFDDGRSKSSYCLAASLLSITNIETSLNEAEQEIDVEKIALNEVKTKSNILKEILNDFAVREGIELKLKKKSKI